MEPYLEPIWSHFGANLEPDLEPIWSHFGAILEPFWSQIWSQFGAILEPDFGHFGALREAISESDFGHFWAILDQFRSFKADMDLCDLEQYELRPELKPQVWGLLYNRLPKGVVYYISGPIPGSVSSPFSDISEHSYPIKILYIIRGGPQSLL